MVFKHILGRKVYMPSKYLIRFLCILNILEIQMIQMLENGSKNNSQDQETPSPIATLPNELLIKVLSLLSTQDLRENVANVSRQFQDLCNSPLVHQVVTVNSCENEADFLRWATMMTELHLQVQDKQQDCQEELMAITNHSHLRVLHVYGCLILDPPSFYSLGSSKWWKNLKGFYMELADKSYDELVHLPDFDSIIFKLGCLENMMHFGFGCYNDSLEYNLQEVAVLNLIKGPSMKKLKSLVVLEPYSETQILEIVEARKETLEEMKIYSKLLDLNFLTLCHKIRNLSITQNFKYDLNILSELKNLTSLEISLKGHLSEDDFLNLTDDLPPDSLPNLTSLTLLENNCSAVVTINPNPIILLRN